MAVVVVGARRDGHALESSGRDEGAGPSSALAARYRRPRPAPGAPPPRPPPPHWRPPMPPSTWPSQLAALRMHGVTGKTAFKSVSLRKGVE